MTRDDIIRMALEAGARDSANPDKWDIWEIRDTDLERFAALVAAHERGQILDLECPLGWVKVDDIRARGEK